MTVTPPEADLTPGLLNLRAYRGDAATLKVTLKDKATGTPTVLPGGGWLSQLRTEKDAVAVVATIAIDATQAAVGILFLTLPDTTSLASGLYYDVECSTGGKRTWLAGRLFIEQDVTRA